MSVDKAEAVKLEGLMITAEKTGNWENVAQEMNDRQAGNFGGRQKDLDDTVKAAADYCNKHGFPMTILTGTDNHVQQIRDDKNSSSNPFGPKVGVGQMNGGEYRASDKF